MSKTEKAVAAYCDMMMKKIETLSVDWTKPWFDGGLSMPVNADMKGYHGINIIWLWLTCEERGYNMPVFMTYNRAHQLGAHIRKGEKATPVFFWRLIAKGDDGKWIDARDANDGCNVIPVLKCFDVFNIAQTTMEQDNPEEYGKYISKTHNEPTPEHGMQYVCEDIDALVDGGWVCPVRVHNSRSAYYNPTTDMINVPEKALYYGDDTESGMQYYSTILHEMAHSTGHKSRLDRKMNVNKRSEDYAREELVAELTAAVIGNGYGFSTHVQEQNAAYLKAWLGNIKKDPRYLMRVMGDVAKAVGMIQNQINK